MSVLSDRATRWAESQRAQCRLELGAVLDECADALESQAAEIARLKNAARSRLKCPEGHSPGESRGACWFCDAERNAADLAALRAAVGELPEVKHAGDCTTHVTSLRREYGCDCGADAANAARAAARKAANLKE